MKKILLIAIFLTTLFSISSQAAGNTSAQTHLATYAISMETARNFIMGNLNNLSLVYNTCKNFGVNNDMIAEIVQSDFPGLNATNVSSFFDSNGFSGSELGFDTLSPNTCENGFSVKNGICEKIEVTYVNSFEFIGNPFNSNYPNDTFARNVWDMQVYNNHLYFGIGNSANTGPSQNVGPVPLYQYNGTLFTNEYTVDEEEIDLFKVYNNTLYIPGLDATQSWDYGNVYTKVLDNNWRKDRTVPKALHIMDLVLYDNKIFAALGVELEDDKEIVSSENNALTWTQYSVAGSGRIYSFLPVENKLYAIKLMRDSSYDSIFEYSGNNKTFEAITINTLHLHLLLPYTTYSMSRYKIFRVTPYKEKTFYIGAAHYNDFDPLPVGLYEAHLNNQQLATNKITLPAQYTPRDMIIYDNILYLLASKQNQSNVTNYVLKANLLLSTLKFEEVLNFEYPIFSRSFELYNNDFYFGMGCDLNDVNNLDNPTNNNLPSQTGNILRIKAINK
ncbi:MAG: hypothetical protein NTZ60_01985 [Campylobacterales bacterium]|nr:hypothetical protein [Campylobacterales bacterium]